MQFPHEIKISLNLDNQASERTITLYSGVTVLLGPNGSGKSQLLRGIKRGLGSQLKDKKIRLLSAGRIGMFEQWRSDYDGQRGEPNYRNARYGSLSDTQRRHSYETLHGDFQTLAVRPDILIKVRERLRKIFRRDLIVRWDGGNLKIDFAQTTGGHKPYSSAQEASGLLHLAGLLSALYDDEVGALLIDEPEVSLHPQLQAFLSKEIASVGSLPGSTSNSKIVVISTHSTEFIQLKSPADLPNFVFCRDAGKHPVQISPSSEELANRKLYALIARMGQEHKLALFAQSPLLVEGPSDTTICGALVNRLNIHLEAGGSQLLPVTGKGQIPTVVKLMRLLGKSPMVMADADSLSDNCDLALIFLNNEEANTAASEKGFGSASEMARRIHSDLCALAEARYAGILTAEQLTSLGSLEGEEQRLRTRRLVFTSLMQMSDDKLSDIDVDWVLMKNRLSALLDMLEEQGCFILRKGTIESYYLFAQTENQSQKMEVAVEEVACFPDALPNQIEEGYADILRCLRRAAATEEIVEAESLQDDLLASATPILARLRKNKKAQDLDHVASAVAPGKKQLFDFDVVDGRLKIVLKSTILDVTGFPLSLSPDEDIVTSVAKALGLDR